MPKRVTTADFVLAGGETHDYLYDYSRAVYVAAKVPLTIICNVHGEFCCTPDNHLRQKSGCPDCGGRKQLTQQQFETRSNDTHGKRYDYRDAVYRAMDTKVTIVCSQHGSFEQTPASHIRGSGCPACAGRGKMTLQRFRQKSHEKHGDEYGYDLIKEVRNNVDELPIVCRVHGIFYQSPTNHFVAGCMDCGGKRRMNTAVFAKKAGEKHGNYYDYSKSEYVNWSKKVTITCPEHGEFSQAAGPHIDGARCPRCYGNHHKNTEEFVVESRGVHGDRYDYTETIYINAKTHVTVICKKHGAFQTLPYSHTAGGNCFACSKQFSQKAINWLREKEVEDDTEIQHALNGGEFKIPETRYKADGYSAKLNKVYEFLGDKFHGNPSVYHPDHVCDVNKRRMGDLFTETVRRKERIIALGYDYEEIWEADWNASARCLLVGPHLKGRRAAREQSP